ncbi:MAG: VanZ family protein [Saccharofermentanales bacterium]|jgi:glycopeptide antibiotics resistance protein
MDVITVFQTLLRWGAFALIGGLLLALGIFAGYRVYKLVFHGQKRMSKKQGIVLFLLCSWLLLVLGLTSFSRGANFSGSFNIDFFSSYVSAWNMWSISELQLIVFNILMFVPLGFLLPFLSKAAEKFKVTFLVAFAVTVGIEIVQLLTGTGIFEQYRSSLPRRPHNRGSFQIAVQTSAITALGLTGFRTGWRTIQ